MRRSVFASAAAASALAVAVIAPGVSNAADTEVTFTITGGDLSITAPLTSTLTVPLLGSSATGGITPVTVSDQRLGTQGWTASAISTSFEKPAPTPVSIPATEVTYLPLPALVVGVAVVTPSLIGPLDTTKTVQTATLVLGSNTATWTGNVSVALPSDRVAGLYTGTITHSVA